MDALGVTAQSGTPFDFDGLKSYSRPDVDLINWFCRAFRRHATSPAWFEDAFKPWLERYQGTAVLLSITNEVDPQETKNYRSESEEIRIGRSDENDIVLGIRALGKQHARLTAREGKYFLEDSGSAIGTYLNDRKLKTGQPAVLNEGDKFLIFPFRFAVGLEDVWVADDYLQLSAPAIAAAQWNEFERTAPVGSCRFEIALYPDTGSALVEGSQPFLEAIISRLRRRPVSPLVGEDLDVFDLAILPVLERVNRDLVFPLQVSIRRSLSGYPADERGFTIEFSVALREATGLFRLFLPRETLVRVQRLLPAAAPSLAASRLRWCLALSAGRIELSLVEFSDLVPGDILIFAEDFEVLLPDYPASAALEKGWKVQPLAASAFRGRIDEYFERSLPMHSNTNVSTVPIPDHADPEPPWKPDLTGLPVRLHVILGQIELSLTELNSLTCNSIIELDRAKGDPVQLAANGNIIGTGSLVEIDGMLGVEITKWNC